MGRDRRLRSCARLVALLTLTGALAVARPGRALDATPHVRAALVSEWESAPAEGPFWVGVRLALDPGWHVYWRQPGDSGLAPTLAWTLPDGLVAGPIVWPAPQRIAVGPLANYGYEDEVLLPVEVRGGRRTPGETLHLAAYARWLVCQVDCLPGRATLLLDLPVGTGRPRPSPAAAAFGAARARAEREPAALGVGVAAALDGPDLVLRLTSRDRPVLAGAIEFFAGESGVIVHAAPQPVSRAAGDVTLRLRRAPERVVPIERLRGIVVAAGGWGPDGGAPAMSVDVPVAAPVPASVAAGLAGALGLALLGGLLLNLMPCVFPVLSIKILDFVRQAGGPARAARLHGLAYALGVVVSMWLLAGGLLVLRATGLQLGWGFQLQSPAFVLGIGALLLAMALNLLGVFEIGIGLTGVAGRVRGGDGVGGAFLTGVLAVIVATPCTAPFMGTALAYALTLPALPALLVFTALGLGMALPYVLLAAFPAWLVWLPRPGRWLEIVKRLLALPLLGAVAWLGWVLVQQTGRGGGLVAVVVLVVVCLAAWVAGRADRLHRPRPRLLLRTAALGLALAALGIGVSTASRAGPSAAVDGGAWALFSAETLATHRAAGRPVFVDFTAAWCLTCQVNERLVLDTEAVQARFSALGVALLRADWTSQDAAIARALEAYGRSSVPLYVLYGRDPAAPPTILPSVLTPGIVLEALDRVADEKEIA